MSEVIPVTADHPRPADDYSIIVLLVDDQAMVGEMVRRALSSEPNLVFHYCAEAGEAVEIAERLRPTVILQDLVLPDIDGLELLRQYRLNAIVRDVPVIVLSTKDEPAVKCQAFREGATDYLVKLPDPVELLARIRHHSKAYLNQIQRDQAYRALNESQEKLVLMNIELQRLSNVDGLTGLFNRRYLDKYLATEWDRAKREHWPICILMIDVDNFKRYNDTYGHLAGDDVLKKIAATIKLGGERPADVAGRFGGEEFIVILPNTELAGAQHVAENIRRRVDELRIAHSTASAASYVTISAGVAASRPNRGDAAEGLVSSADGALYRAKEAGRNQVVADGIPSSQ